MNNTQNSMDLFSNEPVAQNPLISAPQAELLYHPSFFDKLTSDKLFAALLDKIQWKQDKINMYGRELPLPRLSAWYGDTEKPYTYSGITLTPMPWTEELLFIKERIEAVAGVKFTSVLLNRYREARTMWDGMQMTKRNWDATQ